MCDESKQRLYRRLPYDCLLKKTLELNASFRFFLFSAKAQIPCHSIQMCQKQNRKALRLKQNMAADILFTTS